VAPSVRWFAAAAAASPFRRCPKNCVNVVPSISALSVVISPNMVVGREAELDHVGDAANFCFRVSEPVGPVPFNKLIGSNVILRLACLACRPDPVLQLGDDGRPHADAPMLIRLAGLLAGG
jgi:hypothetical protein